MRLAILGATSEIARDFIRLIGTRGGVDLGLFARRPEAVKEWLATINKPISCEVGDFDAFGRHEKFDAVLNFVGVGDPSRAAELGSAIVDVSIRHDALALDYLEEHPSCRYIFLSSGAVYGTRFENAVGDDTPASVAINHPEPRDWYGVSKLLAECRHRSIEQASIVDLRVFNYFCQTQSLSTRFLINDILRAISEGTVLKTSPTNIVRDYLHPEDLCQLIMLILESPPANIALDCYSRATISKLDLLAAMEQRFGLRHEFIHNGYPGNTAAEKVHYYSTSRRAAQFGYSPRFSSMECVLEQSAALLRR